MMEKILNELRKSGRLKHSEGVFKMACCLNEFYNLGVDSEKIKIAAFLHDYTKKYSDDKALLILKTYYGDKIDKELFLSKEIIHSVTGMIVAKEEFKIDDEDILNACFFHTTGRCEMSDLEKLIFLSDYIEENRIGDCFDEVRKLAFISLDKAIVKLYENTFSYLNKNKKHIHSRSVDAYKYYLKKIKKDDKND